MYKMIDLFAGIGGIRLGFERAFDNDAETVFVSEIDKYARTTYAENFFVTSLDTAVDKNFCGHCRNFIKPVKSGKLSEGV